MRVFAQGGGAAQRAIGVFQATVDFVGDIGGVVAPTKSLLCARDAASRGQLALHDWQLEQEVPVVFHQRAPGARLDYASRRVA
eukprot:11186746-Lingulodinium_polyedra.AAC.1